MRTSAWRASRITFTSFPDPGFGNGDGCPVTFRIRILHPPPGCFDFLDDASPAPRLLFVAGRDAHRRGASRQTKPYGFSHHIRVSGDPPPGSLGVREEDNPVSPADKPLNSPQKTNGLLNLSLRVFSFNNSDSDFLVGGLSAGGKKCASRK